MEVINGDIQTYDYEHDNFWNKLKNKYNVNTDRNLHIYTFGTVYLFDSPKNCQEIYKASILRGSHRKNSS